MEGIYVNVLNKAVEQALKSNHYPKIGAVVFKGKRIFGSGHNGIRSSTLPMKHRHWKESLHAEQAALLHLDWKKVKGCSILVLRINDEGKFGLCKPCPMCQKILIHVGIKKVWFTNEKGEVVRKSPSRLYD